MKEINQKCEKEAAKSKQNRTNKRQREMELSEPGPSERPRTEQPSLDTTMARNMAITNLYQVVSDVSPNNYNKNKPS